MAENYTYTLIMKTDGEVGTGTGENNMANPAAVGEPNANNPTSPKGGAKQMAGLAVAGYVGKQAISFVSTRIEQFTGSSQAQDTVNTLMKGAGYAAAIIANPALGITALAVDGITQLVDYQYKKYWREKELNQMRARAGFATLEKSR